MSRLREQKYWSGLYFTDEEPCKTICFSRHIFLVYLLLFSPILQDYHISERFQKATKRGKFSRATWGLDVVMLNSRQLEVPKQKLSQIYDIASIFTHFFALKRDVSTAYCRSSSGDRVDLLSRTNCSTVVVSSWMVAGFCTIKVLLALSEEENVPSAVRSGTANLLTYTHCTFPCVRCLRKPTALLLRLGCSLCRFSRWAFFSDPIDAT